MSGKAPRGRNSYQHQPQPRRPGTHHPQQEVPSQMQFAMNPAQLMQQQQLVNMLQSNQAQAYAHAAAAAAAGYGVQPQYVQYQMNPSAFYHPQMAGYPMQQVYQQQMDAAPQDVANNAEPQPDGAAEENHVDNAEPIEMEEREIVPVVPTVPYIPVWRSPVAGAQAPLQELKAEAPVFVPRQRKALVIQDPETKEVIKIDSVDKKSVTLDAKSEPAAALVAVDVEKARREFKESVRRTGESDKPIKPDSEEEVDVLHPAQADSVDLKPETEVLSSLSNLKIEDTPAHAPEQTQEEKDRILQEFYSKMQAAATPASSSSSKTEERRETTPTQDAAVLPAPLSTVPAGNIDVVTIQDGAGVNDKDSGRKTTPHSLTVGRITYNPKECLGSGSDGTRVFKGTFNDGHPPRDVAVERVNSDSSLADREVEFLKLTDKNQQHPNVIRYFFKESDFQFHYIAIELCQGTLMEYMDYKPGLDRGSLHPITLLQQTIEGLAHLHKLQIVHRDVKPRNVLISMPDERGQIRAMIADFGLCKKLDNGQHSVSVGPSGVVGTYGWGIAPEMLREDNPRKSWTQAVDIFSLGEVFYYVLSNRKHPFGEPGHLNNENLLSNICKGKFTLDDVDDIEDSCLAKSIITKMIDNDPTKRPSATETMADPLFWSKGTKLEFIQKVSDRINKLHANDPVVIRLETNARTVVKINWLQHIDPILQTDLCKFRAYDGTSVRDLLRATRNLGHHFDDLQDKKVKKLLDSVPDGVVTYFTNRFPTLLNHVYNCIESCKN